jgi:aspartyl-tRNA(Asn)/glutamyl-tRNA(Gln) amidotransferase subunit A
VTLPPYEVFEAAGAAILAAEAHAVHRAALARGAPYGAAARRTLEASARRGSDVTVARSEAARLREATLRAMAPVDLLLTAATLTPAPPLADFEDGPAWTAMRTIPFNLTGQPALTLPCGLTHGLPVALQLVGRPMAEATLLRCGHAFERGTDHALARPALP